MFQVALEEFEQVFSLFIYRYVCNYRCEISYTANWQYIFIMRKPFGHPLYYV